MVGHFASYTYIVDFGYLEGAPYAPTSPPEVPARR